MYERSVWLIWGLLMAGVVPVGALAGFLFGDPPNGELDTALAYGSTALLVEALAMGVWLFLAPATAIYFEVVNNRLRSPVPDGHKQRGFALAITALALGMFFLAPVALVIDYFAWRRISSTRVRHARGAATAATAFVVGIVGMVYIAIQAVRTYG